MPARACSLQLSSAVLLGLLAACHSPTASAPPAASVIVERPPASDELPAFVLYTAAQTVLLPFDGRAPTIAAGLWVLDEHTNTVVDHTKLRPIDDAPADEHTCLPTVELQRVSLVGGRLYELGVEWNGACDGISSYDALAIDTPVVSAPAELREVGMAALACGPDVASPVDITPPWPVKIDEFVCGVGNDQEQCEDCRTATPEAELFLLRRGHLWLIRDHVFHAGGTRWLSVRELTPDICPSICDPCGDEASWRARMDLDAVDEFWLTDTAALTGSGEVWAVWQLGEDQPRTLELPGVDATTAVIGVRVHTDARLLADALATTR
jgi:hypothetical protein